MVLNLYQAGANRSARKTYIPKVKSAQRVQKFPEWLERIPDLSDVLC
jgi:hypothetical protein